jgi:ABC-type dipeptide/oligopeptide/nickel transport system ATPase component
MSHLLEVKNLETHFPTRAGIVKAVNDVSFHLDEGELLGIVGESGCGKSITALSIMRLIAPPGKIVGGEIWFRGANYEEPENLLTLSDDRMRSIRGDDISMIFQDPMTSLNPVYTVGEQIAEALRLHRGLTRKQAYEAAIEAMKEVAIPDPARRVDDYPHQLSGGMRQRVELARALAGDADVLLMDEPFSALDYQTRLRMRRELVRMLEQRPRTVIFVTHDIEEAAQLADRVVVLTSGPARTCRELRLDLARPRAPTHPVVVDAVQEILGVLGLEEDAHDPIPVAAPAAASAATI